LQPDIPDSPEFVLFLIEDGDVAPKVGALVFKLHLPLVLTEDRCPGILGLVLGEIGPVYDIDLLYRSGIGLGCQAGGQQGEQENKKMPFQDRNFDQK